VVPSRAGPPFLWRAERAWDALHDCELLSKEMKNLLTKLIALGCFVLTGCDPNSGNSNTGHQLSITDSLVTDQSKDFVITWTLEAPKMARAIEDRIEDLQFNYSIDSGAWQSERITITRMTDSKINLVGRVDRAKLAGHKKIRCFLEYTFDGNREGDATRNNPRTIEITKANKAEIATPRKSSD
jgi:hypothetical protein